MQPRKVYAEIRVDGMTVNGDGIDFHFTCQSVMVDGLDTEVKMKIFNLIGDNIDSFIADGFDLFVEMERVLDKCYVRDIVAVLKDNKEDEDADGEEDEDKEYKEDEDADGEEDITLNSFIELISGLLDKQDNADGDEDDWDEDDWDDWDE